MKKIIIALALLVGLTGLTACSGSITTPKPTPTSSVTRARSSLSAQDEQFLIKVRGQIATVTDLSDAQLITFGHVVCQDLDQGDTPINAALQLESGGLDPYDSGFFVGASIGAYCPQYETAPSTP